MTNNKLVYTHNHYQFKSYKNKVTKSQKKKNDGEINTKKNLTN